MSNPARLRGYSGASVTVYEDTVEKVVAPHQEARFRRSLEKHEKWIRAAIPTVIVPAILKRTESSAVFERVHGRDYIEEIASGRSNDVIRVIMDTLCHMEHRSFLEPVPPEAYLPKVHDGLPFDVGTLEEWAMPVGFSHGDFSLSNMLFKGYLGVFDISDDVFASPFLDAAKLRMDLVTHWSLFLNRIEGGALYDEFRSDMLSSLDLWMSRHVPKSAIKALTNFQIQRVLVYAKDARVANHLTKFLKGTEQ